MAETGIGGQLRRALAGQVLAKLAAAALTLVATSVLVRYLNRKDYGALSAGLAFGALFASFNDPGLNQIVLKRKAKTGVPLSNLVRQSLGLSLALSSVGAVLAAGIGAAVFFHSGRVALAAAVLGCAALLAGGWGASYLPLFQDQLRLTPVAVSEVAIRAALLGALVLVVLLGGDAIAAAGAIVGAQFIGPLVLASARESKHIRPGFDLSMWHALLRDSAPIALALGVYSVYVKLDIVLLAHLGNSASLANYALAYRVIDLANGLLMAAMIALAGPLTLGALDSALLSNRLARLRRALFISGASVATVGTLAAPIIVWVLAGSDAYGGAARPLSLLFIATAFSAVQSVYNTALVAIGQGTRLLPLTLVMLSANIVGNVFLIPPLGATGAALATLATEAVSVAIAGRWLGSAIPFAPMGRLPWAVVTTAAVLCGLVFTIR